MLVPEQYSFETEKAMLRLAGPVRANAIHVYSFTRLAETVFRREGGAAGRRLSDGGRRILMSSAIAACEDQLDVYRSAAQSGRITDVMLTAVNEMKMCGIPPEQLSETAKRLGDRGLGRKVWELSLLYGTYEALVEASYLDSRDDLTRLAEDLETSLFFAGCTVAVDSFERSLWRPPSAAWWRSGAGATGIFPSSAAARNGITDVWTWPCKNGKSPALCPSPLRWMRNR